MFFRSLNVCVPVNKVPGFISYSIVWPQYLLHCLFLLIKYIGNVNLSLSEAGKGANAANVIYIKTVVLWSLFSYLSLNSRSGLTDYIVISLVD